jgi:decaprenylphospho-beta-D-erythro-pentofuranosid-2-ulose 2-reductase
VVTDALGRPGTLLLLGGGSEIGLAIARALSPRTLVRAGRHAGMDVAFDADATDTHQGLIDGLVAAHGDLDVVVLAFGVLGDQAVDETDPQTAVSVVRTNFLGAVSVLTVVANRMREQGHGRIVVLSSVAGERVRRSNYVYGASKAGLDGFALGLGESLRGSGASLLVVRPGFVHTKMTAGLRKAPLSTTPDKVAAAVVRGLDGGAELVWAPGVLRVLMSVLRHLPRPLFRKLPV